jgi:uncharacterized coiled-coil protein SlyX|tara:strand:+ start:1124 stop:1333 length:210 start_codon:yes stop_codon:yes gene_type:complete
MPAEVTDAVQDNRLDTIETRINKHDDLFEKLGSAQVEMMVSLAKLHTSVRILLVVISAGLGLDLSSILG